MSPDLSIKYRMQSTGCSVIVSLLQQHWRAMWGRGSSIIMVLTKLRKRREIIH